ncbi:MAG TPA: VCBS repeat-containing protein [Opitutaceae bacterium]|nr:VCBS repeat-containing protein [Opitutaceae bacterium]
MSLLILAGLVGVSGCKRSEQPAPEEAKTAPTYVPPALRPEAVGAPLVGKPWIPFVGPVDLDKDGLLDIVGCDGQHNQVFWIRQVSRGKFEEQIIASEVPGPVHAEAVDIDGDGDLDLLIASMGVIFPNNEKIGSVIILENDGHQTFTKHVIAEHIARVTDVRAGDFNNDGKLDLAVAQFGYDQGEIRWMENLGNWQFRSHILLSLSGAINVCVADMNGDKTPDIVSVVAQQWEEVFLFQNDGTGNFTSKVIFGSTNEDFGSSGIALCDLNRDGKPDVLYTNGDGFDYAEPGSRPWHGVQWLENLGGGNFRQHRIGDLPGAYSPVGLDFDGDGAMDLIAVSGFNDWKNPSSVSVMLFHNDGRMNFTPVPLATTPTHLMTAAAGDFDGDGKSILITGGFHAYPPYDHLSRVSLWRRAEKP